MKHRVLACLAATLAGIAMTPLSDAADAASKPVCIRSYLIDHTETPDDSTILFYMRNHVIWKNTLVSRCIGLRINREGFTYQPTNPGSDELCSNLVTVRLNDTGRVCLLGAFTPVNPHTQAH
ncbi:MAG TPA: hypothetical protein VKZ79_04995 [Alphaproteobacteria bacterium]|nr:hypothetical protein [Alphaproteobacteria bacterium]